MNLNSACLQRDLFPRAHPFVCWLPLDFDGRVAGRQLLLWTKKVWECFFDLRQCERAGICSPYNTAFSIIRVGHEAKGNLCLIGFPAFTQVFSDTSTLTNTDGQDPTGGWVQCACMTDASLVEKLTYASHNIVRGHSGRFIDVENPIHLSLSPCSRPYSSLNSCFKAAITRGIASCSGWWIVAPAARGWPPPPSRTQISAAL